MDGYTKINGNNKSRSNNFSDLHHKKTNENLSPNHTVFHDVIDLESMPKNQQSKNQEPHDENENETENEKEKENQDAIANEENMKGSNNNPNAVKLSRACSVSSAASANRFRLERQGSKNTTTSPFESVKRAFSMRRSSSVSEKYCRIHDQGFTVSSPILDDVAEAHEDSREKKKKKNGSGRILKACKRLFGI